jgi:hypothetical protein
MTTEGLSTTETGATVRFAWEWLSTAETAIVFDCGLSMKLIVLVLAPKRLAVGFQEREVAETPVGAPAQVGLCPPLAGHQ